MNQFVFAALSLALLSLAPACQPEATPQPEPTSLEAAALSPPAPGSETDALLTLDQAIASCQAAKIELSVEHDTSEAINDARDASRSLISVVHLIEALPPTRTGR